MTSPAHQPPVATMAMNQPPNSAQDPLLYRILVAGLVAAVLITIVGLIGLAIASRPAPEGLVAIGSMCVGGLVGLLVPSPVA